MTTEEAILSLKEECPDNADFARRVEEFAKMLGELPGVIVFANNHVIPTTPSDKESL
jgi:hypothetical protein